jgi:predicted nucleotidyltransferase
MGSKIEGIAFSSRLLFSAPENAANYKVARAVLSTLRRGTKSNAIAARPCMPYTAFCMAYYSNAVIDPCRDALSALCERYRVVRLYLFGSAAEGRFDPLRSDIDFLVQFKDREPTACYAERVFGFESALKGLFNRAVGVVTVEGLKRPGFRTRVEQTRRLVYESGDAD